MMSISECWKTCEQIIADDEVWFTPLKPGHCPEDAACMKWIQENKEFPIESMRIDEKSRWLVVKEKDLTLEVHQWVMETRREAIQNYSCVDELEFQQTEHGPNYVLNLTRNHLTYEQAKRIWKDISEDTILPWRGRTPVLSQYEVEVICRWAFLALEEAKEDN